MHRRARTRLLVFAALALHGATAAAQDAAPEPLPEPLPEQVPELPPTPMPPDPAAPVVPPVPVPVPVPVAPGPPLMDPALAAQRDAYFGNRAWPHTPVAVVWHASLGVDWMRQLPRLSMNEVSSERTVGAQTLPSAGPLALWRAQVGFDVVVSRRWVVPALAIAFGAAVGPSDRVPTAADGSPVEMRPWTTGMMTLLGPGGGVRLTRRRWTVSADVRPVISYVWMQADVATGRTVTEETLYRWVPAVRADLEACRRVGPLDHACVYVEARAYETTFFNGGSVGLRWEFGG